MAEGSDPPFGIGVGLRRAWWCGDRGHAFSFEHGAERSGELAGTVVDDEPELTVEVHQEALLHWRKVAPGGESAEMISRRTRPFPVVPSSAFKGFRFPPEIIVLAVRAAIEGLMPAALHNTDQYANNRVECDHGRLKARLRPMRGLKRDHSARVIIRGHALMQNIRRGHYELGIDTRQHRRIQTAFTELAHTI
jgi:hypothetical protein